MAVDENVNWPDTELFFRFRCVCRSVADGSEEITAALLPEAQREVIIYH